MKLHQNRTRSNPVTKINSTNSEIFSVYTVFTDIKDKYSYIKDKIKDNNLAHIGQNKLCSNERRHLTDNLENKNQSAFVIYAGAAPCNHIWHLHLQFPNVKFLLIDPNSFIIIKPNQKKVTISNLNNNNNRTVSDKIETFDNNFESYIQRMTDSKSSIFTVISYFTLELANSLNTQLNIIKMPYFFWSDIRTSSEENNFPTEDDVISNHIKQMLWCSVLNSTSSMLKFRCPYYSTLQISTSKLYTNLITKFTENELKLFEDKFDIDIENMINNKEFFCFDAEIYLQPWAGLGSTETRLVTSDYSKLINYDSIDYEDKMSFYNNKVRVGKTLYLANEETKIDGETFLFRQDFALDIWIWEQYFAKFYNEVDVNEIKQEMSNFLNFAGESRRSFTENKIKKPHRNQIKNEKRK